MVQLSVGVLQWSQKTVLPAAQNDHRRNCVHDGLCISYKAMITPSRSTCCNQVNRNSALAKGLPMQRWKQIFRHYKLVRWPRNKTTNQEAWEEENRVWKLAQSQPIGENYKVHGHEPPSPGLVTSDFKGTKLISMLSSAKISEIVLGSS